MINYIKNLPNRLSYFFFNKISSKNRIFNLKIDTNRIEYFLELKNALNKNNFLWNGDWDNKKIDIAEYRNYSDSYNSIYQIYKEKRNFTECDEYKAKSKLILEEGKSGRGKSLSELNDYFKSLNELKTSLKQYGYKSQLELKNDSKKSNLRELRTRKRPPEKPSADHPPTAHHRACSSPRSVPMKIKREPFAVAFGKHCSKKAKVTIVLN